MKNCPLTGKPCLKAKVNQITDLKGGKVVKDEKVCQECFVEYLKDKPKTPSVPAVPVPPSPIPINPIGKITPKEAIKSLVEFIDFLSGPPLPPGVLSKQPLKKCPKCESTLEDIAKNVRIGCPECYTFFEKELSGVIQKSQGATKHVGKKPKIYGMSKEESEERAEKLKIQARLAMEAAWKKMPLERRIKSLIGKLKRAVDIEDYEEAAKIRDKQVSLQNQFKKIKSLKSQMKRAVKNEQYERADELKKEIEKLKDE